MKSLRAHLADLLRLCIRPFGYTLAPLKRRAQYVDAVETAAAARARGLTVPQYVAELWSEQGVVEGVLAELERCGALAPCARAVEIGPGTGRYLEQVLPRLGSTQYDIYELDDPWAEHLEATYPVTRQPTDGHSLGGTPDASCGLVQAHNVFVYLPLLTAFEYFGEMARVCAPGGHVVFDFYADTCFTPDTVRAFLAYPDRYQVVLPRALVLAYFAGLGFMLVHEFDVRCYRGSAQYLVLRRETAAGGAAA